MTPRRRGFSGRIADALARRAEEPRRARPRRLRFTRGMAGQRGRDWGSRMLSGLFRADPSPSDSCWSRIVLTKVSNDCVRMIVVNWVR